MPSRNPQTMEALDRANAIRKERARIKTMVAKGEESVITLLRAKPDVLRNMRVAELICAQSKWGEHNARKVLNSVLLNFDKRCGELTDRQIKLICWAIEDREELMEQNRRHTDKYRNAS